MNVHKNARLTPHSRAELVRRVLVGGQAPMAVATAMGVSAKTVRKWVERCAAEGAAAWPITPRGRIAFTGQHRRQLPS